MKVLIERRDPRNHAKPARNVVSVISCNFVDRALRFMWFAAVTALCFLSVLCVFMVIVDMGAFTTASQGGTSHNPNEPKARSTKPHEIVVSVVSCDFVDRFSSPNFVQKMGNRGLASQRTQNLHSVEGTKFYLIGQGPDLDYSKFLHTSQRHASLACTSCHERAADNSQTPRFPGHKACTNCHLAQFVAPAVSMCEICHVDVKSGNPPLKGFPANFNENFNVKFDHAQHLTGAAKPPNGCQACHGRSVGRGAGLGIPAGLSAHAQCYSCHTPGSKSAAGRELASCGVCHDQKAYSRTTTNARSFRYAFSHAKHGSRERLGCTDCHNVTGGLAQSRQVSSPAAAEHFPAGRGMSCFSCHNGRRSFGGDLAFKDCRRCHTGMTFRMPM
jgi:c(7)-type cytochrome triheme protein